MNSTIVQLARRARDPQSLEKDEVLDLIFWVRQIIGLVFGLLAGCLGLTGFPVIIGFGCAIFGLVSMF